jgi:hypothetical protein
MHEITLGCRKLVGFLLQESGRPADFDSAIESSSPTRTNLSALRTEFQPSDKSNYRNAPLEAIYPKQQAVAFSRRVSPSPASGLIYDKYRYFVNVTWPHAT